MIVDLMRNDLGRVCEPGSVRVVEGRTIESHPTVHHGVGEIHGTLAEGAGLPELLEATFPPGSITGAPKIRAMQIIHELEELDRGPYCGAMGWLTRQAGCLSVGIRTLAMQGRFKNGCARFEGTIHYGTGEVHYEQNEDTLSFCDTRLNPTCRSRDDKPLIERGVDFMNHLLRIPKHIFGTSIVQSAEPFK